MKNMQTGFIVMVALVAFFSGGCASLEATAAKDPLKCERDPNCKQHQRQFDCNVQCADDPACIDRCNQVQDQTGTSAAH